MPRYKGARNALPLWVSQNFLISSGLVKQLLQKTNIDKNDHVYEIGPGKGIITKQLLSLCGRLTAIELDNRLFYKLEKSLAGKPHLELINQDFLNVELPAHGHYKIFSSIPYSATAEMLKKITGAYNPPLHTYLILQKEAAYKYAGIPKETMRSLILKPLFELKIIHYFRKTDFKPVPGVDSVLLHIGKKAGPDLGPRDYMMYKDFVAYCFTQGKISLYRLFSKTQCKRLYKEYKISDSSTPSEILYVQWLALFRCFLTQVPPHRQLLVRNAYKKLCLQQSRIDKRHKSV